MFFRCGNFCYTGTQDLGMVQPTLADFPALIPTLQSQQNRLTYYGEINDALRPPARFSETLRALEDAGGTMLAEMEA